MALSRISMQAPSQYPMDSNVNRQLHTSSNGLALPLRVLEKVMNEPTLIDYTEIEQAKKASPHWLSTNYIDLHLRSSRLVSSEAKGALRRHFEQPTKNEEEAAGAEAEERSVPSGGGIPWLMMLDDRSFLDEAFC